MASFKLGTDAGDHLIVQVHGRPDESDDWVTATILVRTGAFSATIDATLVTCDFPRFRVQLETLYRTLSGCAIFNTIEGQLEINCSGNELGGIALDGLAQDRVGGGNELRFLFDIDQTYLPSLIAELREIESEFPNKMNSSFPQ